MYLTSVEFYTIPVMISPILHKLTSTDEGLSLVSTTRQTITQPVRVSKMHQEGIEGIILLGVGQDSGVRIYIISTNYIQALVIGNLRTFL